MNLASLTTRSSGALFDVQRHLTLAFELALLAAVCAVLGIGVHRTCREGCGSGAARFCRGCSTAERARDHRLEGTQDLHDEQTCRRPVGSWVAMFCEACGTRLEERSVVCSTCGAEVKARAVEPEVSVREPAPQLELPGPTCATHQGMPLAGACPRCSKPVCIRCAPEAASDVFTCTDCARLTAAHQQAPVDAACAAHPQIRALFTCARCGSFSCAACAATGPRSEGLCLRCGVSFTLASRSARFGANLVDTFVVVTPGLVAVLASAMPRPWLDENGSLVLAFAGFVVGGGLQLAAQARWASRSASGWSASRSCASTGSPSGCGGCCCCAT